MAGIEVKCKACETLLRFEPRGNGNLMPVEVETGKPHWANCPEATRFKRAKARQKIAESNCPTLDFGPENS